MSGTNLVNYLYSVLDIKKKKDLYSEIWSMDPEYIVHTVNALSSVTALIIHCLKKTYQHRGDQHERFIHTHINIIRTSTSVIIFSP